MNRFNQFRELEFNFFVVVVSFLFLFSSFSAFVYFLISTGSFFLTLISLTSFLITVTIFLFNKNMLHSLLRPLAVLLLNLFCSIEVEGEENLPEEGAFILAGNHTGLLDSLIVSVACKRPVNFVMTNEVFSWPYAGRIVGFFNVISVEAKKGLQAINIAVDALNKGKVLAIFPEGKCTEDGNLNRFHRGVARMQRLSNTPLVPFAIYGGFEAWPIAGLPKPHKIKVQIGQPLDCRDLKEKEIVETLKDRVKFMKNSLDRVMDKDQYQAYQNKVLSQLQSKSDQYASKVCLSLKEHDQWNELSYSELSRKARNFAGTLIQAGIQKHDRLAILSESRPEWAVAFFAGIRAGSTIVPLDIKLTQSELNHILNDCNPTVLCVSSKYKDVAISLYETVKSIKQVYIIDENIQSFENTASGISISRKTDETALIVYTSGTTGNPKGVMISFDNLISQLNSLEKIFKLDNNDAFLSVLPLNHLLELTCGFLGVLNSGAKVVYSDKLSPKATLKTMKEKKITYLITVPLFLKMLQRNIEKEIAKSSKLNQFIFNKAYKYAAFIPSNTIKKMLFLPLHLQFGGKLKAFVSGGAPLNPEIAEFFNRIGLPVLQGYGLTETSPVISMNTIKNNRIGSVGRSLRSVDIKISMIGEVLVSSPGLMKGYYNQPDLTKDVIDRDGWFHTGDIGRLDKEGYLYITGRIKNLIVLGGGKKVFPEEVESVLSQSPMIQEVCVLSHSIQSGSKVGTEEVCAVIVPDKAFIAKYKNMTDQLELILKIELDMFSAQLASYKRPSIVKIVYNELPKTPSNKIKRVHVSEMINKKQEQLISV